MHFTSLAAPLITLLSLTVPALAQNSTSVTPVLTHLFTVNVNLGKPVGPIPLPGGAAYGVTIVEPIVSGNITGSAMNATIDSGSAAVTATVNETVATPLLELWGETTDGVPFFVQATGIGSPGKQFARAIITIGGKYAYLSTEYTLAAFTDNSANPPTASTAEVWAVTRTD